MNINFCKIQYKNLFKNANYNNIHRNNLSPLMQDTVSFGAKSDGSVNMNQAKKSIEQFQNPDFGASNQRNITLRELLNVCKYCGCTIETDGGSHQYHVHTPLGQSHPIAIHTSISRTKQIADPAFANEVITAVKNLDENNGELIFNQDRDDVIVTKDSVVSHTEQKNYYKKELLERRKAEEEQKAKLHSIEQAKKQKLSDKEKNEISALKSEILTKLEYFKDQKEEYFSLHDSAVELLEHEVSSFKGTDVLNDELIKVTQNVKAQLEFGTHDRIEKVDKIIKENTPTDKDTKQSLQEKSSKLSEYSDVVDKDHEEYNDWVFSTIMDNVQISQLQEKYKGIVEIEKLFKKLQALRREFKKDTKDSKDKKEVTSISKNLAAKRNIIKKIKVSLIKNEVSIQDAINKVKSVVDEGENEYLEFLNDLNNTSSSSVRKTPQKLTEEQQAEIYLLILEVESNLSAGCSSVNKLYNLLETAKGKCDDKEYAKLKHQIDKISAQLKDRAIQSQLQLLKDGSYFGINIRRRFFNERHDDFTSKLDDLTKKIQEIINPNEISTEHAISKTDTIKTNNDTNLKISPQQEIISLPKETSVLDEKTEVPDNIFEISTSKISQNIPEHFEQAEIVTTAAKKKSKGNLVNKQSKASQQVQQTTAAEKHHVNEPKENKPVSKKTVGLNDIKDEPRYNYAASLMNILAKKIAKINVPTLIEDLKDVIALYFSDDDIKKLNTSDKEDVRAILGARRSEILKDKNAAEMGRALKFAVLKDIENNHPVLAEELYNRPYSEMNKVIQEISITGQYKGYKPKTQDLNRIYLEYNKDPENRGEVVNFISDGFDLNDKERKQLDHILRGNFSYVNEITSTAVSKGLKTKIIETIMTDYDKQYNTNYAVNSDKAIDNYENKKIFQEKIKIIDDFDWDLE